MTGFTPHQIRSWRKPEFQDKAVFEGLREPNSSAVWYRLVDVEDWRDAHGKQSFLRAIPAPNAFRSSRVGTEIDDYDKRTAMTTLAGINPETVSSWRNLLSAQDSKGVRQYLEKYAEPVYVSLVGEYDKFTRHITQVNRFTEPVWFAGATKALRMYVNDRQNLGFSEEEIDAMPIGAYPPTKESKA